MFFGNIPLYYYSLKKNEREGRALSYFIGKEKDNIIEEIKKFYKANNAINQDYSLQMFIDILKIMSMINEKEIFFFKELKEEILKLPLKFLEIKQEQIELKNLKLYGILSKNEKINDFSKELEKKQEPEEEKKIEGLLYENTITTKFTLFFNHENNCSNYLSNIPKKEKEKINIIHPENYDKKITIFYLDYLFPLMEEIFSSIVYTFLSQSSKYIYNSLPPQSKGGLLESIISQKVKNEKQFILYNIDEFETIENFVPNGFFIQNYISRKEEMKRNFMENKNEAIYKKKKILKGRIFFNQLQFTGKYYDCALLVPSENSEGFKLLLLQISKKKVMSQRFFREEHMIIMNRVKSKLEKEYDIKIDEIHFSYVLTIEELDEETITFCKNNNLHYILFSIKDLAFKENIFPLFNDKTFITNTFPFHTSFSILPKKMFKISKGILKNEKDIYDIQKKLIYEKIENELFESINNYFKPINALSESDENEFVILGHFNEMFEVKKSLCLWFNNNNLYFYTYKKNGKHLKYGLKYPKKLSKENYSLICSKYKIFKNGS